MDFAWYFMDRWYYIALMCEGRLYFIRSVVIINIFVVVAVEATVLLPHFCLNLNLFDAYVFMHPTNTKNNFHRRYFSSN